LSPIPDATTPRPAGRLRVAALPLLLFRALKRFVEQDMRTHAAAVTFHLLFSIFPCVILLLTLLAFLDLASLFDWLRQQSQAVLLRQTVPQVNHLLDQLEERRHGLASLAAFLALWAGSSGMRAAVRALNVVYGVKDQRPLWRRYAISTLGTLAIGALLVVAAALVLARPTAIALLTRNAGLPHIFTLLWAWWLRWPIVIAMLTLAIAVVYAAADVKPRERVVVPGAVAAVLLWLIASAGFNLYVQSAADYNGLYGNVGTMVVLMLYFYISAIVLLFGAELNAVIALAN
jgi:membrane protein